jgi:lysophospholipase L1-like esterase
MAIKASRRGCAIHATKNSVSEFLKRRGCLGLPPTLALALAFVLPSFATGARADDAMPAAAKEWVATWTASMQAPFAAHGPSALIAPGSFQLDTYFPQPDTIRLALANNKAEDQTFRMMVRPDIWSDSIRIRFSNTFGAKELKLGAAAVGLQEYAANIVPGTNAKITFNGGHSTASVSAGQSMFSDPISLPYVSDATKKLLRGRNLAVSFSIDGAIGSLSYHDTAFATSYIGKPHSGNHAEDENGGAFPFATDSWFVVDEVDAMAPTGTAVVCAFGDSITDGTYSTLNGNDRWPDALARRIHEAYGDRVSVVNEAITGNAVTLEAVGRPATERLDRDVLSVSGLTSVIWLEGVNDLASNQNDPQPVIAGYKVINDRLRKAGIIVIAATLTPSYRANQDFTTSPLGTEFGPRYGGPKIDESRKVLNAFIRTSSTFDQVADTEAAVMDPATGTMRAEFVPQSASGPGDSLHPNRAGYEAMAGAIDLTMLAPGYRPKK